MSERNIPLWAQELKELFCSNAVSQFLIYGNIFDFVHYKENETISRFMPLKNFLEDIMLEKYDIVIFYDRGKGIRASQSNKEWSEWLNQLSSGSASEVNTRDPSKALKLIDTYLLRALNLQAIKNTKEEPYKHKIAVVIDFAQFIVPSGDSMQFASELGSHVVNILNWANDPSILNSNIATFLITEKLNDVNKLIVQNSHTAKIEIKLPSEEEMFDYIKCLSAQIFPDLEQKSDVGLNVLAKYLTGLSRIAARNIISFALKNNYRINQDWLCLKIPVNSVQ